MPQHACPALPKRGVLTSSADPQQRPRDAGVCAVASSAQLSDINNRRVLLGPASMETDLRHLQGRALTMLISGSTLPINLVSWLHLVPGLLPTP